MLNIPSWPQPTIQKLVNTQLSGAVNGTLRSIMTQAAISVWSGVSLPLTGRANITVVTLDVMLLYPL